MNFFRALFKLFSKEEPVVKDKYRIVERGDGTFAAQEWKWARRDWKDLKDSEYQSVCYEEIVKRREEDEAIKEYMTIKRVIKV
jgi:hypothetical protein